MAIRLTKPEGWYRMGLLNAIKAEYFHQCLYCQRGFWTKKGAAKCHPEEQEKIRHRRRGGFLSPGTVAGDYALYGRGEPRYGNGTGDFPGWGIDMGPAGPGYTGGAPYYRGGHQPHPHDLDEHP